MVRDRIAVDEAEVIAARARRGPVCDDRFPESLVLMPHVGYGVAVAALPLVNERGYVCRGQSRSPLYDFKILKSLVGRGKDFLEKVGPLVHRDDNGHGRPVQVRQVFRTVMPADFPERMNAAPLPGLCAGCGANEMMNKHVTRGSCTGLDGLPRSGPLQDGAASPNPSRRRAVLHGPIASNRLFFAITALPDMPGYRNPRNSDRLSSVNAFQSPYIFCTSLRRWFEV